jgi:hypothetical protein
LPGINTLAFWAHLLVTEKMKNLTRVKVTDSYKRFSLLLHRINYSCKMFYSVGPSLKKSLVMNIFTFFKIENLFLFLDTVDVVVEVKMLIWHHIS